MFEQYHPDFDESVGYKAGMSLAKAVNQAFPSQQYKFSTFTVPPCAIEVCGSRKRLFDPYAKLDQPTQLAIEFPPEPPVDKWKDLKCSSHMRPYLTAESLEERLHLAERVLKVNEHRFDSIAFRGMSGAFLGPPLAMRLHKGMILVRKDVDDSHSCMLLEGFKECGRYVIVDDFVSTKSTINNIIDTVYNKIGPATVCVGVLEVEYLASTEVWQCESGTKDALTYKEYVAERIADLKAKHHYKPQKPVFFNLTEPNDESKTTAITLYRQPLNYAVQGA